MSSLPGGAFSHTTQLHGTFGNVIHVVFYFLIDLVEQFVQPNEVGTLYVPVCLLGLRLQINGSASRALSSSISFVEASPEESFLVLYIVLLLNIVTAVVVFLGRNPDGR